MNQFPTSILFYLQSVIHPLLVDFVVVMAISQIDIDMITHPTTNRARRGATR